MRIPVTWQSVSCEHHIVTQPGERRRIDRVLAAEFSAQLKEISTEELRARRLEADAEENDLSFQRRVLHTRIDMLDAEIARRHARSDSPDVVAEVVRLLSEPPSGSHRSPRLTSAMPGRLGEHRRAVERLVNDPAVSYVAVLSDESLQQVKSALLENEREVSQLRRRVQSVVDLMSAELTVRHRNGEAGVNNLLA